MQQNFEKPKDINKITDTIWEIPTSRHLTEHPTEKPEKLIERIILIGSKKGDTILDPFMGSGTTGVVAKKHKRNFIGFEIDDKYFNIAKKRVEKIDYTPQDSIPIIIGQNN